MIIRDALAYLNRHEIEREEGSSEIIKNKRRQLPISHPLAQNRVNL